MKLPTSFDHIEVNPNELRYWLDGVEKLSASVTLLRTSDDHSYEIRWTLYPIKAHPFKKDAIEMTKEPFYFLTKGYP